MRVLLLNPPAGRTVFRDGNCSSSSKSGYCWHPLDLLVQSGILTGLGFEIELIDAIGLRSTPQEVIDRVLAFQPHAVIGQAGDVSWEEDVLFYQRLGAAGGAPRLLLTGDVPRFEPQRTFDALPDLEAVVTSFVSDGPGRLLLGESGGGGGLILRDGTRVARATKRWTSPPARHDLFEMGAYRLPFHHGEPFASVLASYGCPFSCTFCNTGELPFERRDPAEVAAEVEQVRALGYRRMYLRDATANGSRTHWLETCHAIEGAQLKWNVFCTFQPFDAAMAQAMARAGCEVVQFGIETGDDAGRADSGKPFANEAAVAAVRYAQEAGIRVCGHFVLGLPGQREPEVRQAATFARELGLDWASFNLAAARPGTPLRSAADAAGIGGGDPSGDGFIEGLADVPAKRLKQLRRQAILRFYLRPGPLRAVMPDLRRKSGWSHLWSTARAVARTL